MGKRVLSKMKTLIYILILVVGAVAFAANTPAKKPAAPAGPEKRLYTEEEFKKAVLVEAEKLMKKAGSGHLVDFSKELLEKEEALKVKELNLQKKEEQLKVSTVDFSKKLVEFQDAQKKFLGCVDSQNEKSEKRVSQMVDVISGMKPQSAADVLAVQDPDLSVRILGMLDAQKASKIFNLMDKEVSAKLQKQYMQMKK
jgi:flagellar motility protein MotE (MotC chaperone)